MARVPSYDNLQTRVDVGPTPNVGGPNPLTIVGEQQQQVGAATSRASDALSRIMLDAQDQANQVRVNDAMNQAMGARLKLTHDKDAGYSALQGRAALDRPDGKALDEEFGGKLDETLATISAGLGNDAQRRVFQAQSGQLAGQFRGQVQAHMGKESQQYALSTAQGGIKVAHDQMALDYLDPQAVAQGRNAIKGYAAEAGRLLGLAPADVLARTVEALSPAHGAVLLAMVQDGKSNRAAEYLKVVRAEMTPADRAKFEKAVKQSGDVQTGEGAADQAWNTIGPRSGNDAVKLFDMEKVIRAQLKDNPDAMKHAIDSLGHRARSFNAQQAETNAAGVNAVFKMLDKGAPIASVMMSEAWMSLPDLKQHEIRKAMDNEAHTREQRAYTAELRAGNAENRSLIAAQRQDSGLRLQNADAYLRYGDPTVLAGMTRQQVEATRTVFGLEGAQHLLQRFDMLQKPGAVAEARMDKQDFDFLAKRMGLDPLSTNKGERDRVGDAQFRIEQLILRAQTAKKGALSREEKMSLVTVELAQTVQINPTFSARRDAPVLSIQADQINSVVVPGAQRAALIGQMAQLYAENNDPRYAPTNDNLKRYYLRKKSPAADLIGPSK